MSGVDGMEMSVQAAQEAKQTDGERQDREGIDGGAAGETESAETQEEEKRERRNRAEGGKERKTLHTSGEEHRKPGARACTGEGEEPSLRSFRPLARQTALRSAQKSRAFCSARSSLHLRTDPFARCHRTLLAPFALAACMQMHPSAPPPVIIAARGVRVARPI